MKKIWSFTKTLAALCVITSLSACSDKASNTQSTSEPNADNANTLPLDAAKAPAYLNRNIQDEVFYFVMPDRFHNANPDNDNGDPERTISYGGLNTSSKWAFHGGDIAGVEAKLDYIQGLGITSIWMTPILRNKAIQNDGFGHHGYWVVDFTEIDPHFGSNDDLKSLIAAAHKRNIKVFFDIITNHTADVIKYKECHQENGEFLLPEQKGCEFISTDAMAAGAKYTPFVQASEKDAKVPAWLNDPKYYNNQGDSFWEGESAIKGDFVGLDDLDTSQPEVIAGLTEVFQDLITEFKPDGFRIDTVKHVDIEFWQSFGPAIMRHAQSIGIPEFFIFGEVYDGNPAGLSKFTTAGKLPSVLDFSFAFNTRDVLFNNKAISQLENLFNNDDYYRDHDSSPNDLLNFLGNHDMGRLGHFIEHDLPTISEDEKLQRAKLAHAFMYFSRGIPVVYYGDEQGFTGDGGDVDARENMDPSKVDSYNDNNLIGTNSTTAANNFDVNHPLYSTLAQLADVRKQHLTLRNGEHINKIVDEEKRIYGFSRVMSSTDTKGLNEYMVVFNFSTQAQQISIDDKGIGYQNVNTTPLHNNAEFSEGKIHFNLPALSYSMIKTVEDASFSQIEDITMGQQYADNGRVFIPFDISFQDTQGLNFVKLEIFDTSATNDNVSSAELIAFDTTYPYRAVLTPEQAEKMTSIKVVVNNYNAQSIEKSFSLTN